MQRRWRATEAIARLERLQPGCAWIRDWAILRHTSQIEPRKLRSWVQSESRPHATSYCSRWLHLDAVQHLFCRSQSRSGPPRKVLDTNPTRSRPKPPARHDLGCLTSLDACFATTRRRPARPRAANKLGCKVPPPAHTTSPPEARGAPAMITHNAARGQPPHARSDARRPEDARRLIMIRPGPSRVPVAPQYQLGTREAEAPHALGSSS